MSVADLDTLDVAYSLTSAGEWREDSCRAYCEQDGKEIVIFETKHFDARGMNVEGIVELRNAWPSISEELRLARKRIVELEDRVRFLERGT